MAKRRVMFTFTSEVMTEPIIYNLGQQFKLITNIRRADLTEDRGYIILELDGVSGLAEMAPTYLQETRGGRNVQHELVPLLRQ